MLAVRRLALALGQEAPRLFGQEAPRLAPRTFVTSTHLHRKTDQTFVSGSSGSAMREKVRALDFDNSVNTVVTLDSLAEAEDGKKGESEWKVFPDEKTHDQLFNGIKFTDIPIVLMRLHRNNTKLNAIYADGRPIWSTTPAKHGFLNAKKRTNVAGQVAGLNMGQRLRGLGIRTIRLRINGFNAARISTVQGLTQAGVQIVAIEDVTVVNWHWPQRARIAPSKN